MTDINIPVAALEAGARALCNEQRLFWPDLTKDEHNIIRAEARAAFLAIVEAWPGLQHRIHIEQAIVLPLPPQETHND